VGTLQNTFEGRPGDVRNFCLLTKETLASRGRPWDVS